MALTSSILTASILGAAPDLRGPNWILLASAVGGALPKWLPAGVLMTGVVVGSKTGSGTVSGKVFIPPSPVLMSAGMLGVGFTGPEALRVASGIGVGICTALNASGTYIGVSVGAIGKDTSKIVFADGVSLSALLAAELAARGFLGPQAPILASGLATGIAAMLLKGNGTGIATGAPSPVPGTGGSKSQII